MVPTAEALTTGSLLFLVLAIVLALGFEFVNGFHDTANAVATVIYTNTLRPWVAVIWSGAWNLLGVLASSGGIAFAILALLPVELIVNIGTGPGFAMVFSLLTAAILWNLGTWYFGLPASSSHTLIGSIMGVGLANALLSPGSDIASGVNWSEVAKVFRALLFSPLIGFFVAAALLLLAKALLRKRPELFAEPPKDTPPPRWVRGLLILTCTGVSFAHGSNDGQKGMGLLLLILIGILPGTYALNPHLEAGALATLQTQAARMEPTLLAQARSTKIEPGSETALLSSYLEHGHADERTFAAAATIDRRLAEVLRGKNDFTSFNVDERKTIRTDIYLLSSTLTKLAKTKAFNDPSVAGFTRQMNAATQFIPAWVKFAVALALGLGTMIGWKRIVVTVGEKIGKTHLTYAQGASAELVAMATIIAADQYHLPVSTTHVLSSGIAGTMAANRSGLQIQTLRNLATAWVLTLPVSVLLGAITFAGGLYIVVHSLIVQAVAVVGLALLALGAVLFRRVVLARTRTPAAS
ncbi:MAG: inorganic phosphate transporter [Deltaproteobacteria bacterium]|nr:inorganic phosphate transporter [Deltaproteobacteria bacterium]